MKAKAYWNTTEKRITLTDQDGNSAYEPLLTEAEWQARHPLVQCRLEDIPVLSQFLVYERDRDRWAIGLRDSEQMVGHPDATYYELPPLSSEREEEGDNGVTAWYRQDEQEAIKAICELMELSERQVLRQALRHYQTFCLRIHAGETCTWSGDAMRASLFSGKPVAAPAPSPVGERLTKSPEVGEWYVRFHSEESAIIRQWGKHNAITDGFRYYRWLGPIPVEPKPEKVEPPKWLGAIRDKDGEVAWVTTIAANYADYVWSDGNVNSLLRAAITDDFTLAPDIMPPSPELAALFTEGK